MPIKIPSLVLLTIPDEPVLIYTKAQVRVKSYTIYCIGMSNSVRPIRYYKSVTLHWLIKLYYRPRHDFGLERSLLTYLRNILIAPLTGRWKEGV